MFLGVKTRKFILTVRPGEDTTAQLFEAVGVLPLVGSQSNYRCFHANLLHA